MSPIELVRAALRLLGSCSTGSQADAMDMEILRRSASPGEIDLPIDKLACAIVERVCEKELSESRRMLNGEGS